MHEIGVAVLQSATVRQTCRHPWKELESSEASDSDESDSYEPILNWSQLKIHILALTEMSEPELYRYEALVQFCR